ncbi:helix-turn-helix domain-containing protein [Marinobacterium weihaiense]|uniref:Helix-turn-helix domain-containing protein n=1 Tax=Marinobacterium weihaiense TaxID=2851016 RepID=A0ABS6MDA2_9GAMM|nr:helix-turn-helix domain-containing protein [Marinobacterium weihaiense]MBV0934263.1 helix-turn-helix domain-containing protein [Marinobacterium weihaiense]
MRPLLLSIELSMVKSIESLARGLRVVEAIRHHAPVSLSLLHQQTGISKATLLRILRTLQEAGWVYRALGDSRYRLSFTVSQQMPEQAPGEQLAELAAPAVPVFKGDEVQATLALSWPQDAIAGPELQQHYYPLLRAAADRLAAQLQA